MLGDSEQCLVQSRRTHWQSSVLPAMSSQGLFLKGETFLLLSLGDGDVLYVSSLLLRNSKKTKKIHL